MAIKKIVKVPDPVLNLKTERVVIDEDLKKLVTDLLDTLTAQKKPKGAGLAAPQIGVSMRVCIAKKFSPNPNDEENDLETDFILINPIIVSHSEGTDTKWEACLSIPNTYGKVERYKKIKVETMDLHGNTFTLKADGFFARIIQHEIDHLDGILYTSKVVGETVTEKELDELYEKGLE